MNSTIPEFLAFANKLALEAGKILMKHYQTSLQIQQKDGDSNNLVSQADLESEQYLISTIQKAYPTHSILAEESGAHLKDSDYTWILDPLDGTTNFIHTFPLFAISIALQYKAEIIVGSTYCPVFDEHFFGSLGSGAFLNGKKIQVSEVSELGKSLTVTGFPSNKKSEQFAQALKLFNKAQNNIHAIRRTGSATLDLAYLACGRFDGFFELGLKPWDIAAGVCILKEAGGKITNLNGSPLDLNAQNITANNGKIHEQLVALLSS